MRQVFIGHTSDQDILYQVAKFSILQQSSDIICRPIKQQALRDLEIYQRNIDEKGTTEFSLTRFLTPWLAGFKGWVLFCDNDVLALSDINELFDKADSKYALMCVKHDYTPKEGLKLDGKIQRLYPRKNWSSVVLWNAAHPKNQCLTPDFVNEATPMALHRFSWLEDNEIGELPIEWNWLVDWYHEPEDGKPKLLHFTEGGPYFKRYQQVPYANLWRNAFCEYKGRHFTKADIID